MAMNTPQVQGPDSLLRETLHFSTTAISRFFVGTMDADTVSMEVSIRGSAFTSDPDLILFEGTSWQVPNSLAYPDGLDLQPGSNEIRVRAISASGAVSAPAAISVQLIQESDVGLLADPPTNVSVERFDNAVEIKVEGVDSSYVVGYNFYASLYPGGGLSGYSRVNLHTINTFSVEEETDILSQETVSIEIATTNNQPAAVPLFVKLVGTQIDVLENTLQEDFASEIEVPETTSKVTTTYTVSSVREVQKFAFLHSRSGGPTTTPPTITIGAFGSMLDTEPLYYVVTAVYFDPTDLIEFESSFSVEVVANPLRVRASVGSFPVVTRQHLTREFIGSVFRSNPQLKVEAGSVLRDTIIDPFASEAERVRFLVDFLHRTQSFASLLQVDDPQNTGVSAAVSTTSYKQALKRAFNIVKDSQVQGILDMAFEHLASNFGVSRLPGTFARGEVTFYTTIRPTQTLSVPIGTTVAAGSVQFKTTRAVEIPFSQVASFRDQKTGRYTVTVPVQAVNAGVSGNIGSGQIRRIQSSLPGLSVINNANTFGGKNTETNLQLATRTQNALASVDSGTARGYLQTIASVPGILTAEVVPAMHELMMRDFEESENRHYGGKVDIWVQGENLAQVTDTFAFAFDIANNIQFELLSNPANLTFRALDPTLSVENPLVELLDYPTVGYSFRNATTGQAFDLTDVTLTSYNIIQLSTAVAQPTVSLTDVVLGDYRKRTSNTFTFSRQPVRSIVEVVGTVSGTLPTEAYSLSRPSSPLREGRSSIAGDYLTIVGTTDDNGDPLPTGNSITVTDESHVLIGEALEYVDNLGANPLTIVVYNEDRTIEYKGPNHPSGMPDYTIVLGDETTSVSIKRIPSGDLVSGQVVSVDYQHDENFTVRYNTNLMVSIAQDDVNEQRHVTADVLVKEAIAVPVDIAATIVLKKGTVQSTADLNIRTNLGNQFKSLRLNDPIRQSDVAATIDNTAGVSYVLLPLTLMVRAEGSIVLNESITTSQPGDVVYLPIYSNPSVSVWLLKQELDSATTNGGGPTDQYRAVLQNDLELALQTALPGPSLASEAGRTYIIGSEGLVIQGYSDDTTLEAEGYNTAAEREAERLSRTANRILVSTLVNDSPNAYSYKTTYIAGIDKGAKNIEGNAATYLTLGEVTLTFDEDR